MSTLRYAVAVGAAMLVAGSSADAQLRRSTSTYPDAQTLPTGTCRVWIDGLPANQQPAPTDCATARRNQPRNSRIIYGSRATNVYGNRDPRSIPGTPQYDPRYDPRSSQYDPRLDPHNRGNDGRSDDRFDRRRDKEREKWERKQEKEREKEWKKSHKGSGNGDEDDDEDDDADHDRRDRDHRDHDRRDHDGRHDDRDGRYGTRGPVWQGCVDANRDGICDNAQSTNQPFPIGIPQTIPQGTTTRRVCVDANRDGRCDDGGPLVRITKP